MRAYSGDIDWDIVPLQGWGNVSPEFFADLQDSHQEEPPATEQAVFVYEDPGSRRPLSVPISELVDINAIATALSIDPEKLAPPDHESLPIQAYEAAIVDSVKNNPFTFIKAETGAGKSTQVGKMLVRNGAPQVYHTHPRKVAARNVYERQVYELGYELGQDEAEQMVAYRMRGEAKGPDNAPLMHVTDGLELAIQLASKNRGEEAIVIIDEVHEANTNMEFLIAWAKQQVRENNNLRFVFMSADIDTNRFVNFVSDVVETAPPVIEVPGRMFPVERIERPSSTVVKEVAKAAIELYNSKAAENGDPNGILVFLPGKGEIEDVNNALYDTLPPHVLKAANIFALHAKLPPEKQQAALQTYEGVTTVAATNVAETSLTIPGVAYVIDSGLKRQIELDDEGGQGLVLTEISQAESNQRAGRAGRVSPGTYILTRPHGNAPFRSIENRPTHQLPEILRTDITRTTLRFAAANVNIANFELMNQVDEASITRAQEFLQVLGALNPDGTITERGIAMNEYSVGAPMARALVEVGRYNDETKASMAAIAAAKEVGLLQNFDMGAGDAWKVFGEDETSDLFTQLNIFIGIQGMDNRQLLEHDLDPMAVGRALELYNQLCRRLNVQVETLKPPTKEQRDDLLHCILTGSLNNIYKAGGNGLYHNVGSSEYPRELGTRTSICGNPDLIVGERWRVVQKGAQKHILEQVTKATAQQIAKAAVEHLVWSPLGFIKKDGLLFDRQEALVFNKSIGLKREQRATASPRLRARLMQEALENPGTHQLRLRAIKRELEDLAHLTPQYVEQLTQDKLVSLIEAATPQDVEVSWTIDNNIGQIILKDGISRQSFVSDERAQRIRDNAPDTIRAADVNLQLSYQNGVPLVKERHYSKTAIAKLSDELRLDDGREIYFIHDGKRKTLYQMQELLGISSFA